MPDRVKEKLVELLGASTCKHDCCEDCQYRENEDACIAYLKDIMADYLIAHGVTVQPYKAGDTVYEVDGDHGIIKHDIYEVCVVYKTTASDDSGMTWDDFYTSDDIGTAYKTRRDAETSVSKPTQT